MKQLLNYILLFTLIYSCKSQTGEIEKGSPANIKSDQVYQYSVFTALANKIYDGTLTVGELKTKGDLGLGTYNGLNGEMIVIDGNFYQVPADGNLRLADDSDPVPFAAVVFFEQDKQVEAAGSINFSGLNALIEENLPSRNMIYALKINGDFEYIKCGSADKMEKPYEKTLSQALVDRPVFEQQDVSGTLVGFWFPVYMNNVNVPGLHLHFVSDNHKIAGHVLDFKSSGLKISLDICSGIDVELAQNEDFLNAEFDLSQGYN